MSIFVSIMSNLVWQLQGKSMEPPSWETNVIQVYDVMWVEVRQTVAKAHIEFKMVIPS
jgi:hypothetical protein